MLVYALLGNLKLSNDMQNNAHKYYATKLVMQKINKTYTESFRFYGIGCVFHLEISNVVFFPDNLCAPNAFLC